MEVTIYMAIKKDGVGNDRLTFNVQAFQPGGCDCDTPGYEDEVGNDNVVDLSCSDSVKVLRTLPMELTDEERDMVKGYLKISDITRAYIAANGHLFIVMNDGTERDVGDARGIPGDTPEFGDNGNWFIGGKDTGVPTTGPQGDAPYIGENGNWWVSGKDLGIRTGKPKLGDIMESLQHPGAGWVACDGGIESPGTPLYDVLPYNTEWRKVPTEKAGLPQAAVFKPLPVAGQWYYMQKYTGSGSYGDEAFVYDANTDTIVTFSCPSVSNAVKSYGMTGLTHDGDRYVLCVAEMAVSDSMTGVTHFFTSTNLEDWEYQASFNARSNGYFATDLYFDGTYLLVIEHYGYGEHQEYVVRFDKALSKRTELKGIGTDSHSFITLPASYWSYATTSDKYVTVYGSGGTTVKFTFSSSSNLGRVAFFNDRYWFGLPVSGSLSNSIQIADLTTNEVTSLSVSTATGGLAGLLANAVYDPNANEWVLYAENGGTVDRYEVRISAAADPTNKSNYKVTPISVFPATLSYEQMKPDRSQMLLSSGSYRLLRDPNLKYRPKSCDNPHYIYAGVGGEAIVAPSMYAVDADAVHYYSDDVTDAQRARARENIGAASVTELNTLREDVDQRIANVPKFSTLVVESLPLRDISDTTVYLVPTGDGEDLYTEYINVNGKWEKLGTQPMLSAPAAPKNVWFGTCDTAANVMDKVVTTTTGDFRLEEGNILCVYFKNALQITTAFLNVDGTGSVSSNAFNGSYNAGDVVVFAYSNGMFYRTNRTEATTTFKGVVKLSSSTSSSSEAMAATPKAVRETYMLARSAEELALDAQDAATAANTAAGKLQQGVDKLSEEVGGKANGIIDTATGEVIALTDSAEAPLSGLVVYGKSTQDGTPTPDAPVPIVSVGEDGVTDVGVYGANLIRFPYHSQNNTSQGITWTINEDGSVTANGTATANSYFALTNKIVWHSTSFNVFDTPKTINGITFSPELNYNSNNRQLYITVESGKTVTDKTFYPMANYGNTLKPYEPYKPVQTLPASTPDGLCGIPVTSGGNYTDASGQQWACDEIDFVRGVRVQRVGKADMSQLEFVVDSQGYWKTSALVGTIKADANNPPLLSDKYTASSWSQKSNGNVSMNKAGWVVSLNGSTTEPPSGTLHYELLEPIETPLTEDELASYRALHTHYPNTTIYADDNAGLFVGYYADTKLYIDKKFAELAAAIVNN